MEPQTANDRPSKPTRQPRNGVDVPTLFATIDAVRAQPELAAFQWRASNRWIKGTHSRTTIEGFTGAGGDHQHATEFSYDVDHPPVLVGDDQGPTPVELLLAALASCLTAGIANVASARGINLTEVESRVEGDIDLQGILGLSDEVRNGYQALRVSFRIRGDAEADKLRQVVEQSRARSAVFDVLSNGTSIAIDVDAA
ncbi:MAG: OsmC family protein [Sandaracinaceae bacterium]